jgi:hypothetical protein
MLVPLGKFLSVSRAESAPLGISLDKAILPIRPMVTLQTCLTWPDRDYSRVLQTSNEIRCAKTRLSLRRCLMRKLQPVRLAISTYICVPYTWRARCKSHHNASNHRFDLILGREPVSMQNFVPALHDKLIRRASRGLGTIDNTEYSYRDIN